MATRRSSMIDDQAGCDEDDSDDSMEDLTIAERCARLVARTAAMKADTAFLNDHATSSDDKDDD